MNEEKILQAIESIAKQIYSSADQLMALTGYIVADKMLSKNNQEVQNAVIDLPTLEESIMKLKHGNGSITKRTRKTSKGIYAYYQGTIQHNNERYTVTAKTQKECFEKLRELKNKLHNITKAPKANKLTFGAWLEKWYTQYKVGTLKPNSLKNIRVIMNKFITNELKNKDLRLLKAIDLQICINQIESSRQKYETVKVLKNALRYAKLNGHIKTDIWEGISYKKHEYKITKTLSRAEQQLIINQADGELRNCIIGYLWTGCRRNELLNIKKSDCNFENNTLIIRGTKTKTSFRTIPIFKPILNILQNAKENDYIFKITNINAQYKKLCDHIGLQDVTIHSLRHTFATNCLENGINLKTIQHWMGHSKMSTTTDIYTHLSREQEKRDTEKMNNLT